MKKLLLLASLIVVFISCKKDKIQQLPVNKMYLVEYRFNHPSPPDTAWIFYVNGISEIDKFCNITLTQPNISEDGYHTLMFTLPDSIKRTIAETIEQYPHDTSFVFAGNENTDRDAYKGYYYFIWAERDYNKPLLIDLYLPDKLHKDWQYVVDKVYDNHRNKYTGLQITDTDSLKQRFALFERSLPYTHITRPPRVKWVQFTPPVANDDDE